MRELRHPLVLKDLATIQEDSDCSLGTDQKPRFTIRQQRKVKQLSEESLKEGNKDKQDNVHHIKDKINETGKLLLRGDNSGSPFSSSTYKLLPPIGQSQLVSRGVVKLIKYTKLIKERSTDE